MKKQMKKQGKQKTNSTDFQTVWKVNAGSCVEFNAYGLYTVDWGDGYTEQVNIEQVTGKNKYKELKHTYVKKGEYTVAISPGVTQLWLSHNSAKKLIEIKQWGAAQWESMTWMFAGAENMICTATDTPDLSKVDDMSYMFCRCKKFNSPIEHWDTKGVEDMTNMLSNALTFNQPLANMDLKAVKQAIGMLEDTPAFDQDLSGLYLNSQADTRDMFGNNKSLVQYNEEYAERVERYEAQDLKQDVYSALDGAGK